MKKDIFIYIYILKYWQMNKCKNNYYYIKKNFKGLSLGEL